MPLNNILLVDDDKAFNFLNRISLTENNITCTVTEALNGQQALDYLLTITECPDVILPDINMPVIDGFEFLKEFEKLNGRCIQTKIFLLTSSQNDRDKLAALRHRLVSGYFVKPITNEHVSEILAAVN